MPPGAVQALAAWEVLVNKIAPYKKGQNVGFALFCRHPLEIRLFENGGLTNKGYVDILYIKLLYIIFLYIVGTWKGG